MQRGFLTRLISRALTGTRIPAPGRVSVVLSHLRHCNKLASTMSYSTIERGQPNTLDYRVFYSKFGDNFSQACFLQESVVSANWPYFGRIWPFDWTGRGYSSCLQVLMDATLIEWNLSLPPTLMTKHVPIHTSHFLSQVVLDWQWQFDTNRESLVTSSNKTSQLVNMVCGFYNLISLNLSWI